MKKRLYKSPDKKIGGVCGGIADYLGLDATIVRLIFVGVLLLTAVIPCVIGYLVAVAVIPSPPQDYYSTVVNNSKRLVKGADRRIFGVCSGFAEYFGIEDPTPLRLIVLLVFVFTAFFPIGVLYLVAGAVMPSSPVATQNDYNNGGYQQPFGGQQPPYGAPFGGQRPPYTGQPPFNGQPNQAPQQPTPQPTENNQN